MSEIFGHEHNSNLEQEKDTANAWTHAPTTLKDRMAPASPTEHGTFRVVNLTVGLMGGREGKGEQ